MSVPPLLSISPGSTTSGHSFCRENGVKKVPSGQNMPSGNLTGRTAGTENIIATLTAIVPFATGRKRRSGKLSNVTGFGHIHVTTWDGAAVPVGSASSATKTNSPVLPQSARNAFRKSPCWNNNSGVPSNGNVTFCPSSEPVLRIITLPKHGEQWELPAGAFGEQCGPV